VVYHYQKTLLCRVPATHGKIAKPHGKIYTVCLLTANNTRQRKPRQRVYAVSNFENARWTLCHVLQPPARQSKASNASQTSTETRGGLEITVCCALDFAVRCAARWLGQFVVCLQFAVCSTRSSLPWALSLRCALQWTFAVCFPLPWAAICRGSVVCRVSWCCILPCA
jgi:hypothetical protein